MKTIIVIFTTILFSASSSASTFSDIAKQLPLDESVKKTLPIKTAAPGVPLTGDLSNADEEALGREIAGRLLSASPLVKNDKLQNYVNKVGRIVAGRSSRPTLHWTFGVIDSTDINAFSAPGGYVYITAGLYRLIENEAELAGVLGHEITHITLRHHVKLLQKTRALELGRDFLLGKVTNDSVKKLAGNGAVIYARALDKDAEFSCDRLGIQLAANAGYDPFAFIALLDRIGAYTENADKLALLYKTHPHPSDRLTALDRAIGARWDTLEAVITPARIVKY